MGIGPSYRRVAISDGVITIPSRCSVICLGIVMVAITVAAHIQNFVLSAMGCSTIEFLDLMLETLPLSQVVMAKASIAGIGAVDETKVGGHEIECARIDRGLILQKEARDCSVINIGI